MQIYEVVLAKLYFLLQVIESLLSELSYIPSTLFLSEVPYVDFLDRVHVSEIKLRAKGLWEVPHPWLNLLIPKSRIHDFAKEVFGNILRDTGNGPILIYPVNKSKYLFTKLTLHKGSWTYTLDLIFAPSLIAGGTIEHLWLLHKKIFST